MHNGWPTASCEVYLPTAGTKLPLSKAADGSGETERIGESDRAVIPYSWSPDGTRIAVMVQNPETTLDLAFLSVEDGSIEPFLSTQFVEYGPVFSPDGRWIAYGSNESGAFEVYVRPAEGGSGKWQISSGGNFEDSSTPTATDGCSAT